MFPLFQLKDVQILLQNVMFPYKRKCTEMHWFLEELPTIDTPTSTITSSFAQVSNHLSNNHLFSSSSFRENSNSNDYFSVQYSHC